MFMEGLVIALLTFLISVLLLQVGEVVGSAGTEGAARPTNKTMYSGKVCPLTTLSFSPSLLCKVVLQLQEYLAIHRCR